MVNKEFFKAFQALMEEKGLSQEVIKSTLEAAMSGAYKKNYGEAKPVEVRFIPEKNTIKFYSYKTVVDDVVDPEKEISLPEAKKIKKSYKVGDRIYNEESVKEFNRIAAQTAKQIIIQKMKEIEKASLYSDIAEKEGKLVVANVKRIDGDNIYLEIGGTSLEGLLTLRDIMPEDKFRPGDKVKVFVRQIKDDFRGTIVQVTRTNTGFVKKLLELEVPELSNGDISIVNIVREPGVRTKIALSKKDKNLDAVGACIGNRGMRINNVIAELKGEKIDLINYSDNAEEYIASALSPATVSSVVVDSASMTAKVLVPENKLSLAIGKNGHNVRLAAKLTGYKIDVKGVKENEKQENDVTTGINFVVDDYDNMFDDIED